MRIYVSPAAIDRMEPRELVSAEDELDRAIRRREAELDELEELHEQVKRRLAEATDAAA